MAESVQVALIICVTILGVFALSIFGGKKK